MGFCVCFVIIYINNQSSIGVDWELTRWVYQQRMNMKTVHKRVAMGIAHSIFLCFLVLTTSFALLMITAKGARSFQSMSLNQILLLLPDPHSHRPPPPLRLCRLPGSCSLQQPCPPSSCLSSLNYIWMRFAMMSNIFFSYSVFWCSFACINLIN